MKEFIQKANNKMNEISKFCWNFIDTHKIIIFAIIISLLAVFLRVTLYPNDWGDYDMFIKPWFDELQMRRWFAWPWT